MPGYLPKIECFECNDCTIHKQYDLETYIIFCTAMAKELYRVVGTVSVDSLNAPVECPRRKK